MPNALRLSTAAPAPVLARRKPISGITPAQSRARQNLGGLNSMYKSLTMAQKGGWQTVANTLNTNQNRTGKNKIHPANAFITLNAARLACGCPCLSDAPAPCRPARPSSRHRPNRQPCRRHRLRPHASLRSLPSHGANTRLCAHPCGQNHLSRQHV